MNQIFEDHLPYMIGAVVAGVALVCAPGQTKPARRIALGILVLACLYPCAIVGLYVARNNMGESYAYLIAGVLLAVLLGLIGSVLLLAWVIVYAVGIRRQKRISNQASQVTARKLADPQH